MFSFDIQLTELLSHLFSLGMAYLLALPIGLNREKEARSAWASGSRRRSDDSIVMITIGPTVT